MTDKPNVLILGGCGFIARHLVHYLITNDLAKCIRIVDKTPPVMAWLNSQHAELYDNPIVEFCSANLINSASCKNAFLPSKYGNWDIIVNCAAETRPNQSEAVYKEGILKLSIICATETSLINGNARYIELSSGCMNSNEKSPLKEDCKCEPWTSVAQYKLKVEKELRSIPNLNYTIFRLPIVYGIGDKKYLTPRIIIGAIYKYLNETMKLLWNESLKLNTIHVKDVVAAIWQLSQNPKAIGEIYNLVDDSNSTQGTISEILSEVFGINIDYWGVTMSNLTKINYKDAVSEINDKHLGPWAELCEKDGITNTPLTPYMDEELLYHKHLNLDNTKLKDIGYELQYPHLLADSIKEIINDYVEQNLFPKSLML